MSVSHLSEEIKQVTEIMTSQSLARSRRAVRHFLTFEFLDLEYSKIDTKIESVAYVLDEIRKVMEIVTSQSRASGTSFLFILESSTSNLVKSTQMSL